MIDNTYKTNGIILYDTNKGIRITDTANTESFTNLTNFIIIIFN